jgi:hypothetical protein
MNNRAENLLRDVLAEASPADFREVLLGETLRLARRRRQFRQTRRMIGVLALFGLLSILATRRWPERPVASQSPAKEPAHASYQLLQTQPLPAAAIVTTRRFEDSRLVRSLPTVVQIATTSGGFREINDEQLLALLVQRPGLLVRTGPQSEELVFANPQDRKGFPVN